MSPRNPYFRVHEWVPKCLRAQMIDYLFITLKTLFSHTKRRRFVAWLSLFPGKLFWGDTLFTSNTVRSHHFTYTVLCIPSLLSYSFGKMRFHLDRFFLTIATLWNKHSSGRFFNHYNLTQVWIQPLPILYSLIICMFFPLLCLYNHKK